MRPGPIRPGDPVAESGSVPDGRSLELGFNEARADSPGRFRCYAVSVPMTTALPASMRPGPIRPGDPLQPSRHRPRKPKRFNEARADSPGRCLHDTMPGPSVTHAAGFNEARADSPEASRARDQCRHCFNEARADSPGRCPAWWTETTIRASYASMRPGPIRPGDRTKRWWTSWGRLALQLRPGPKDAREIPPDWPSPCAFRRCFNEARADSPGRSPANGLQLSPSGCCFNEARADSPGRLSTWSAATPSRYRPGFNEARADSPGRYCANGLPKAPPDSRRSASRGFRNQEFFAPASMRPGPIRPGDDRRPPDADRTRAVHRVRTSPLSMSPQASMRPGPIRPGDCRGRPHGPRRFNAARPCFNVRPGDRFNEARADSPGRLCEDARGQCCHHMPLQ